MPGFVVKVQATGLNQINIMVNGAKDRAQNLTVPLKKAGLVMLSSVNKNFRSGGRPSPWRPLAQSTIRQKLKNGGTLLPLTGASRRSFGARTGGGNLRRSITFNASRNKLVIGTSIVYGAIHQYGGRAGRNHSANIPARPYLVFQKNDLNAIKELIVSHIAGTG